MSASTTPTEWPRAARATARLVVTDDLPTPPLPDEISSGRVFEPGWLNGTGRPVAWPCGCPCACASTVALQPDAQLLALVVGHHREVELDARDARRAGAAAASTRDCDLVAQRAAGDGEGDEHRHGAVGPPFGAADHAEVDDRAVQLGVLDRPQRVDELLRVTGILPSLALPVMSQAALGGTAGNTFTAAVSAITDAFGDPTRRRIYLFVRAQTGPTATATAMASRRRRWPPRSACTPTSPATTSTSWRPAGTSRSPARPQDGIAAQGRAPVEALRRRPDRHGRTRSRCTPTISCWPCSGRRWPGCRVRRPRRWPRRSARRTARALAAGLTGDALATGQRSLRSAMQAVADALTAHGFAARTSEPALAPGRRDVDGLRIISDHCPFGNVAIEHPVLCAVDRGMVRGMLAVLYPSAGSLDVVTAASKAHGDTLCATAV